MPRFWQFTSSCSSCGALTSVDQRAIFLRVPGHSRTRLTCAEPCSPCASVVAAFDRGGFPVCESRMICLNLPIDRATGARLLPHEACLTVSVGVRDAGDERWYLSLKRWSDG
ncbi:hypothetical protein BD309DRAFT_62448 [Dichomitus squalens]|nr:hypothetical protein BD309DRAFT_62448 [Dichomitus squalens]